MNKNINRPKPTIDLHMHSYYSDDGEFSPNELVRQCLAAGIRTMAITDHNSVRAIAEGREAAKQAGIEYIPAIEIDCTHNGLNLHILGYGIDHESSDFTAIEENITAQSTAASYEMLAATQKLGFRITETELTHLSRQTLHPTTWTGEMFAEVLLHNPEYQTHPLLTPYRPGGPRSDNPYVNFYWDYYAQGKPCYVKINYPSLQQTADIIRQNHGYAVLAHPAINLKEHPEQLSGIIQTGLSGIEAYSSYHTPAQARYYEQAAQEHGIFITCGSDYHGKTKPSIQLGQHGCLLSEPEFRMMIQEIL